MPRVAGVDIPVNKRSVIALTYVFGIGRTLAAKVLKEAGIDESVRAKDLTEDQVSRINAIIEKGYVVEGSARRLIAQNISRLKSIGCYRGFRHRRNLPVRGQRTRTNARTRKGPRKTIAGKKQAKQQG
ncbi:MAG: 30S ribosomal protein S13 [Planctomycetes bacterium RBG_16_59_8]|nr:MAG: 30S ribosomal protein S13 [Planctomycetes bacterium RBG_16_59_8]